MSRQLLRNSKVVVVYKGVSHELRALSSISADTTFNEVSGKRKTLFNNTPKKYSIVNRQNSTSISLNTYFTQQGNESIFFELIGLSKSGKRYSLPDSINKTPETFEVFIINTETSMHFSPCFLENIDIALSKESILSMSLTISAAKREIASEVVSSELVQKTQNIPTPVNLRIGESSYNSVTSVGISIQQEAEWRDDKTLFTYDKIYTPSQASLSDLTLSVTANTNLDTNNIIKTPEFSDVLIQKSGLSLCMNNARVIPRISPEAVYTQSFDISPTDNSGSTYFLMEN